MSEDYANGPRPRLPPPDFRFVTQNQMSYCWTRYNEFLLCAKKESREDPVCQQLMYDATVICPSKMITDWEDQRSNGKFLGVQYDGPGIEYPEE